MQFTRQPQVIAGIEWGNPITRGLVAAWTPANDTLLKSGVVTRTTINAGNAIYTDQTVYEYMNSAPSFSLDECSMIAIANPTNTTTTTRAIAACGNSGNSNPLFYLGHGASGGQAVFRTRDVTPTDTITQATSANWNSGITSVIGGVRSLLRGNQYLYVNGDVVTSTAVSAAAATTFDRFSIGGLLRSSFALGWDGKTSLVLIFARGLSDAEMHSLYVNPWQVFRMPKAIRFGVASGIAFDAAANAGYNAAASTYTFNRTVTGSNTFLSVDVHLLSVPGTTVTSVVDDSGGSNVNMTFIGAQSTVSGSGRVECWGLANPTTGTKSIQVNLSASIASTATAVSYTGVHQTSPYEAFNSAQAKNVGAADATVTITTVADNCWVHGACATDDTAITAGQTSRNNVSGAGGSGANEDNNGPKTPAGNVTISYTDVGALATWTIAGYAIRPIAASSLTGIISNVIYGAFNAIKGYFS